LAHPGFFILPRLLGRPESFKSEFSVVEESIGEMELESLAWLAVNSFSFCFGDYFREPRLGIKREYGTTTNNQKRN
jgi:hypothetical protein